MVAPIATVSESSQHASTSDDSDKITAGPHPQVSRPLVPGTWPIFLRTVAVYATQVAYRIFSQPLQPITDRLRARAAASEAVRSACERLQVDDLTGLQDLCNSLILAESVYKCVGRPEAEAARFISALKAAFPGVASVSSAQFARPHVRHRFVVAEGGDAIYVAFMGTKMAKDYLTNAAVWQEEVRLDAALLSEADAEGITGAGAQPGAANGGKMPAAHRGFLSRARAIPIDSLYAEAARRGKRLVLCG